MLLVEDDAALRNVLAVCLRIAGFKVETAADERSALARFRDRTPAMVVSDLMLPDGEGMNALQEMRSTAPETPIVVMSGGGWFPATHLLGVARSLGAAAALSKPFRPAELVDVLRELQPA